MQARDEVIERFSLQPFQIDRLDHFVTIFTQWNAHISLVSAKDSARIWSRHIPEALWLADFLRAANWVLDLGSGGGFPGLITAINTGVPHKLVESDQRKAAFLREAVRQLALEVEVIATRIETLNLLGAPCITARALAPLPRLLSYAQLHLAPEGLCLFPKGANVQQEIDAARQNGWMFHVKQFSNSYDSNLCLLEIRNLTKS